MKSESERRSVMSNSLRPHGLCSPWNSPGQNTGVGSLSLLQGIFPIQGSTGLLHCRWILLIFLNNNHISRCSWITSYAHKICWWLWKKSHGLDPRGLLPSNGGGHGKPLRYSCLENPMGRQAWWATVRGLHRVWLDWSDLAQGLPRRRW